MDELETWEMNFLLENYIYSHRESWEQTRKLMWASLQANSTKKIPDGHNLFPLYWDKEYEDGEVIELNDIERIKAEFEHTNSLQKMLKKGR